MSKGMILYQSKYGATKKYADWLRERTGFDCVETRRAVLNEIVPYETLIVCGGIYASGIAGLSFLKRNAVRLRGKRIAVLCVGASPYDKDALEEIKARNMQSGLEDIPLFYARGAWDEARMTGADRMLCGLLKRMVAKKSPDTYEPWMKALMDTGGQACDWTDPDYLTPLLRYLRISE